MSNRNTGITAWKSFSWSPGTRGGRMGEGRVSVGASCMPGLGGCRAQRAAGTRRPAAAPTALAAQRGGEAKASMRTRGVVLHQLGQPQEEPLAEGHAGREERARGALHDAPDLVLGIEVRAHNGLHAS